jgi:hypothetical protein
MADFLLSRPAPFVIGAMLGLTVVGVLATLNRRVGVLGGYSALYERAGGGTPELGWKAWFLGGILLGSLLFRLLAGSGTAGDGYGWLTRTFTGDWRPMVGILLVVGGAMIGYGAKQARGCTAANGICGTALASPASFVATGTFMAVAVGATFAIDAVIA